MALWKFGVIYRDPALQLERFENVAKAQKRYNELSETAVEDLMFIIICEEKRLDGNTHV